MTIQPGAALYTQGFGTRPENVEVPHIDVRPPASTDVNFPIGKSWVDTVGVAAYTLAGIAPSAGVLSATWVTTGGGTGALATLTGDTGTATPVGGNIKIAGTASQITTAASGSTVTLSLPSAVTFPGSATATTSLAAGTTVTGGTGVVATTGNVTASAGNVSASGTVTGGTGVTATTGNITATNGNLSLAHIGNKILIATGTNASIGTATLTTGTVTVANTAVTASSLIFVSYNTCASTLAAALSAPSASISAGVHFVINSEDATDSTSTVNWWIIN